MGRVNNVLAFIHTRGGEGVRQGLPLKQSPLRDFFSPKIWFENNRKISITIDFEESQCDIKHSSVLPTECPCDADILATSVNKPQAVLYLPTMKHLKILIEKETIRISAHLSKFQQKHVNNDSAS